MSSSESVLSQAKGMIENSISCALEQFQNERFGTVRIVMRNNDPWFVAKDVAACIDYDPSSINKMCSLCRDKDRVVVNGKEYSESLSEYSESRGNPNLTLISESGLYRILAKCNLPKCEPFESWVFDEVLPSIRKTGKYSTLLPNFSDPAEAAIAWAKEYREKQAAIAERDRAIRTKYLFVEGRDAEMCGRVGGLQTSNNNLRCENEKLKDAVGRGQNWQTIAMMRSEWIREYGHKPDWHKLHEFSKDVMIAPVKDVEEKVILPNGGEKIQKSYRYHKDAWQRYRNYEELLRGA